MYMCSICICKQILKNVFICTYINRYVFRSVCIYIYMEREIEIDSCFLASHLSLSLSLRPGCFIKARPGVLPVLALSCGRSFGSALSDVQGAVSISWGSFWGELYRAPIKRI